MARAVLWSTVLACTQEGSWSIQAFGEVRSLLYCVCFPLHVGKELVFAQSCIMPLQGSLARTNLAFQWSTERSYSGVQQCSAHQCQPAAHFHVNDPSLRLHSFPMKLVCLLTSVCTWQGWVGCMEGNLEESVLLPLWVLGIKPRSWGLVALSPSHTQFLLGGCLQCPASTQHIWRFNSQCSPGTCSAWEQTRISQWIQIAVFSYL